MSEQQAWIGPDIVQNEVVSVPVPAVVDNEVLPAVVERVPNLFSELNLDTLDLNDEEASGKVFGRLFGMINRTIINPPPPPPGVAETPVTDKLYEMLGMNAEQIAAASRLVEVKRYFMEQLQTLGMKDAIVLTKERFNLPDDYGIKIETTVLFRIEPEKKTEEPDLD